MLVHRYGIVKILPSGIGCRHGETARAFDFRDAVQRPLQVLHRAQISVWRFHRGGEGLQVADRFAEFGRNDAAGGAEFGQGFGMEFAQECRLEVVAGTHEKRTEHDDLRVE